VPGGTIPAPIFNCPADKGLDNQTVRNVVLLTAGGDRVRVRLTNTFRTGYLRRPGGDHAAVSWVVFTCDTCRWACDTCR
jgi:hypothetical protein